LIGPSGFPYLGYWFECSSWSDPFVENYDIFSGVTTGTPYHLVLTFDAVDTVKFYVNGSLVATQTLTSPALPFTIFSDSLANPLTVGNDGFGPGDGVAGTIDEVALYDSELDATRVAAHYAAGLAPPIDQELDATQTQTASRTATFSPTTAQELDVTQTQTPTLTPRLAGKTLDVTHAQTPSIEVCANIGVPVSHWGAVYHNGGTTYSDTVQTSPSTAGVGSDFDTAGEIALPGDAKSGGTYFATQNFYEFDTYAFTSADTASLELTTFSSASPPDSVTFNVAPYNWGGSDADWRDPTALAALTTAGTQAYSFVGSDQLTYIFLLTSGINFGGITRLVLFTDAQLNGGPDPTGNDVFSFHLSDGGTPPTLRLYCASMGPTTDQELDVTQTQTPTIARSFSSLPDYPTVVAADNPYIWLRCDDASGDLVDSGSAGFNAPVGWFGTPPTYAVTGLQTSDGDKAFHSSAGTLVQDYNHDLGPIVGTPSDGWTIEIIVNFTAFDDGWLLSEGGNGPTFAISASGDLTVNFDDPSFVFISTAPYSLTLGTTYYLAATFDKASGDFVFYVNGSAVETQPAAATGWQWSGSPSYFEVGLGFNNLLAATVDEPALYLTD
jgi:hypothetical protein